MWPWTTKPVLSVNFSKLRCNTSSESWINNRSIDVRIGNYNENLKSEGAKKSKKLENLEKVLQIKSLMHFTHQKSTFDIFTVRHLQDIFMEHDLYLIS